MITQYISDDSIYHEDENQLLQGEYKSFYKNGNKRLHCFFKNDVEHGEYKYWDPNGVLITHYLCINGEEHNIHPDQLSTKDKDILSRRFNVKWLP